MVRISQRNLSDDMKPVDNHIDDVWAETVILRPMKYVSTGYRASVPDDSRQVLITRGIYDQTRGAIEPTGGGMIHTQATVDTSLSIRAEPVAQVDLRKGDRVEFPARGEKYDVTFIHVDPGGRPDVHLVKLLDDE